MSEIIKTAKSNICNVLSREHILLLIRHVVGMLNHVDFFFFCDSQNEFYGFLAIFSVLILFYKLEVKFASVTTQKTSTLPRNYSILKREVESTQNSIK